MQVSEEEAKVKYGVSRIWYTLSNLHQAELYSGTDKDPEVQAKMAASQLAVDETGRELPYDVKITFYLIELEEGESIYEMDRKELHQRQIINTQLLVFNNFSGYQKYRDDSAEIVFQLYE